MVHGPDGRVPIGTAYLNAFALFVCGIVYVGVYGPSTGGLFTFRQDSVIYASTGNTFGGVTRSDAAVQSTVIGTVFILLGSVYLLAEFFKSKIEILLPVYSAMCRYVLYATMIPMLAHANGADSLGAGIFMMTALMGTVVSGFVLELVMFALRNENNEAKLKREGRARHFFAMRLDHGYHSAPLGLAVSCAYVALVYLMVTFGSPFNSSTSVPTNVIAASAVVAVDILMNVVFVVFAPHGIHTVAKSSVGPEDAHKEAITYGRCRGMFTSEGLHNAWTVAAFSAVAFLLASGPGFT